MSEIWNEFEKIAAIQGLVAIDRDAKPSEREQEDPHKMPTRYDSLSDDAIRLLYGVEPETIFKDKDIIEVAHPETSVVFRAYDAMNAVVENVNQRQDMMAYIAQKMPNGHLTQRRYVAAKGDLVKSLVQAGFMMENNEGSNGLVTLADSCVERLANKNEEKILKEAGWPLIVGAGLLLGGAWYLMYGATTAQNVYANSQIVLDKLDDLMDQPYAGGIYQDIQKLMTMAEDVYSMKDDLSNVTSVDAALTEAQKSAAATKAEKVSLLIRRYVDQLNKVQRAIPGWIAKIEMAHSTEAESSSDWMAKLKGLVDFVVTDDWQELINALYGKKYTDVTGRSGGLYEAISEDKKKMQKMLTAARQQTEQAVTEMNKTVSEPEPIPVAKAPKPAMPEPTPAPGNSVPASQTQESPQAAKRREFFGNTDLPLEPDAW